MDKTLLPAKVIPGPFLASAILRQSIATGCLSLDKILQQIFVLWEKHLLQVFALGHLQSGTTFAMTSLARKKKHCTCRTSTTALALVPSTKTDAVRLRKACVRGYNLISDQVTRGKPLLLHRSVHVHTRKGAWLHAPISIITAQRRPDQTCPSVIIIIVRSSQLIHHELVIIGCYGVAGMTRGEGHKTQVLEVVQDRLPFAGRCPPIKEQVRPATVEGVFCIAQQGDETMVGDEGKGHHCMHFTYTHTHTHTHIHTHTIPC